MIVPINMDIDIGWIYILIASALEPCWVLALEKSDNFRKLKWGIVAAVLFFICTCFLALAVGQLGPGLSFTLLAGLGSTIVVFLGAVQYKEVVTPRRILFVMMIIAGVIGVRLVSGGILAI